MCRNRLSLFTKWRFLYNSQSYVLSYLQFERGELWAWHVALRSSEWTRRHHSSYRQRKLALVAALCQPNAWPSSSRMPISPFENTYEQTVGIEEGSYPLLSIKFGPISADKSPIRIHMLSRIDLSDSRPSEGEFDRLVQVLRSRCPH